MKCFVTVRTVTLAMINPCSLLTLTTGGRIVITGSLSFTSAIVISTVAVAVWNSIYKDMHGFSGHES